MNAFEFELQIDEPRLNSCASCHACKLNPCLPHTSFNYLRLLTTQHEEKWGWKFFFRCHKYRITPRITKSFFYYRKIFAGICMTSSHLSLNEQKKIAAGKKLVDTVKLRRYENTKLMSIDTLIPSFFQSHPTIVYCPRNVSLVCHNFTSVDHMQGTEQDFFGKWKRHESGDIFLQQLNGHCWWLTISKREKVLRITQFTNLTAS